MDAPKLNITPSLRIIWLFSKTLEIEYLPSDNHYWEKTQFELNLTSFKLILTSWCPIGLLLCSAGIKCGHFTEKAKLFLWSICDRFMVRVILLLALSRFHDFLRPQTSMLSSAFCFHLYWTCFFMRIVCPQKLYICLFSTHVFSSSVRWPSE